MGGRLGGMETCEGSDRAGELELLAFFIWQDRSAISISSVREIRGWTRPTVMPNSPLHAGGMINLRGEVLPLLDVSGQLGPETPRDEPRSVVIVIGYNGRVAGLHVAAVSDIVKPSLDHLRDPPDLVTSGSSNFIWALVLIDDQIVRVLDAENLLGVAPHVDGDAGTGCNRKEA